MGHSGEGEGEGEGRGKEGITTTNFYFFLETFELGLSELSSRGRRDLDGFTAGLPPDEAFFVGLPLSRLSPLDTRDF
jgi:hypothetical protein